MINIQKSKGSIIHSPATNQTIIRIEIALNKSHSYPPPHHSSDIVHGTVQHRQRCRLRILFVKVWCIGSFVKLTIGRMPHHIFQFLVPRRFLNGFLLPAVILHRQHFHPPREQIQMADPDKARRDARRYRASLFHHHVRIALRLSGQLAQYLPLLPLVVPRQPRVVHAGQLPALGIIAVPRSIRRVAPGGIAHDERQGARRRYSQVVHRLRR
mmetsp:Transcript_32756/g.79294  ORF Transcript_32756/g.79294 Transcript_32756/m.79294 type:complete len:212 (+) Transcript_32756:1305-1940(+)